jgi:hypothetical protein
MRASLSNFGTENDAIRNFTIRGAPRKNRDWDRPCRARVDIVSYLNVIIAFNSYYTNL